MIEINTLTQYCNQLLNIENFNDYCPNGLQIEGKEQIHKIVTGVTANQALIDAAIEQQADIILVHHGFFWKGEAPQLSGIKYQRIKSLIEHKIALLAYHLPLDAHPELGNNILLAKALKLQNIQLPDKNSLILSGEITPVTGSILKQQLFECCHHQAIHIDSAQPIKKVAICTGAAQSYIQQAIEMGADAYISGEISESTVHIARENHIHYFAAGHHATERFGVRALGEHLAEHFNLTHQFIDISSPV